MTPTINRILDRITGHKTRSRPLTDGDGNWFIPPHVKLFLTPLTFGRPLSLFRQHNLKLFGRKIPVSELKFLMRRKPFQGTISRMANNVSRVVQTHQHILSPSPSSTTHRVELLKILLLLAISVIFICNTISCGMPALPLYRAYEALQQEF